MRIHIAALILFTISICHAADKKFPLVDSASFSWGQTCTSTSEAKQSDSKIKSALLNNGFTASDAPKGNTLILPEQKESGVRIVTWYTLSNKPELKAAVIKQKLYTGYAFFIVPSRPTSLEVIWTPYKKLLGTVKDQAR